MRKMMLLAAVAAIAALMLAATPAMADDLDFDGFDDEDFGFFCDNDDDDSNGFIECDDLFVVIPVGDFEDFCDDFDFNGFCDFDEEDDFCDFFECDDDFDFEEFCDDFDGDFFCDDEEDFFFDDGVTQNSEQEVESGDATQNINVVGGGDNSNQLVGIQGVVNTGNATNNTSVIQTGASFDGNNNDDEDFCDFVDCNNEEDDFCDFFGCNNEEDFCDFFECNNFDNGFGGGEVEIEDVGNFTISPSQTVTGTQQVNQAAVAVGKVW